MIVTQLKGGLGNQMFQYAAGRRLALRRRTRLYMDLSWFDPSVHADTKRVYELDCFNLEQSFINRGAYVLANDEHSLKVTAYRYTKGLFKPRLSPYIEKSHTFDKQVLSLPDKTYLDGFWQNENYFVDARRTILEDFKFKSPPSAKNARLLKQIKEADAVSVHVRRGDYASNKETGAFHGLMGLDYYNQAVSRIAKKVKDPHFFIFSDEPEWCEKHLKIDYPATYVSHNSAGFEDLRLMSRCKHHVTANSSFSWWGAWLNPRADKIVISPKRWFADPSMAKAEIIPRGWIKL